MIIKVFSFALLLIMLVWALSGCLPQDSIAAKVPVPAKEIAEPKTSSKYWRPSEDLTMFIMTMENKPLLDGEIGVVEYDDVGHIAKGYGTKAYLFTDKESNSKEAHRIMVYKLLEANGYIDKHVTFKLNEHQRDALVSLIYNIGRDAFRNSAAFTALNKGDVKEFKRQAFDSKVGFVCADGKFNQGLINRRAHEQEIWENGSYVVWALLK
jgi:lysozyme